MPDANLLEGVSDSVKVAGGAGGGGLVALLLSRLFGGQDRVLVELKRLEQSVSALTTQVQVMAATAQGYVAELAATKAALESLRIELAKQGQQLARHEALIEQVSEGVVR